MSILKITFGIESILAASTFTFTPLLHFDFRKTNVQSGKIPFNYTFETSVNFDINASKIQSFHTFALTFAENIAEILH